MQVAWERHMCSTGWEMNSRKIQEAGPLKTSDISRDPVVRAIPYKVEDKLPQESVPNRNKQV